MLAVPRKAITTVPGPAASRHKVSWEPEGGDSLVV